MGLLRRHPVGVTSIGAAESGFDSKSGGVADGIRVAFALGVVRQDALFSHALCRIEVRPDGASAREPASFAATMFLVLENELRPLMFEGGIRAVIHAPGEALALAGALRYLQKVFGPLINMCRSADAPQTEGPPIPLTLDT